MSAVVVWSPKTCSYMDLLRKTTAPGENNRKADNSDKLQLFAKEKRPHPAVYHKEQWAFITDISLRENIAYQMQYLEF